MAEFEVIDIGVVLAVSDFAASLEFYTKNLAFEQVTKFEDPPFAILERGSFRLCLAEEGHAADDCPDIEMQSLLDPNNPPVRLVLWVSDCVAAYESLVGDGVRFLGPPTSPSWGGLRCFAIDPDGYLVELEQFPDEE